MKGYFDYVPGYCPSCGVKLRWNRDEKFDWDAGENFSCNDCGAQFQRLGLLIAELDAVRRERDALVRWQTAKLNGEPLY